ncbi:nuclear RNA export factor 1-like isoform X1 [Porites lutea]|uniref:nuclear RNA export factor 1-like isoform X1 n=1 Tax=Porites lutea TaxID=51062 RepID=UPI003CC62761
MSKNLFAKAVEDATLEITTSYDGSRNFGGKAIKNSCTNVSFLVEDSERPRRGRSYRGGRGRGRGNSYYREKSSHPHPRSHIVDDDDDIDMDNVGRGGHRSDSRFNPYRGRPPSRRGDKRDSDNRGDVKSRLGTTSVNRSSGNQGWHKVVIVNGKQHDKDWLIRKLQSACEEPFQAVDFHYFKGESAAFFVEGSKVAEAMKKVSHKITVRDGSKLILTVRPSPPPHNPSNVFGSFADSYTGNVGSSSNLDDNTKEVLKQCLGERYDATSKILNLSDLYHDEVLNLNNVQGILSKYPLASAIVRLIGENCPEVQSLDISSNRLRNLDGFKDLGNQASSLKHLKICNNQLRTVEELDKIKSLNQLVSLELDGNPLCDVFQSKGNSYINSVRSRFPKVTSLDGHELPAPIGFDLPSEQVLPPSKDSFLGDPPIKELVLKFLEQYFKIYDTGDRQGLLEAYHDQAIFSLCVNTGVTTKDRSGQRGPSLGEYLKNSRNMKRVIDPERRYSYLKHSRLSVVAFLNELPTTKHDLSSFKIDVSLALPSCLSFAVRGLFLENSKSLRSFTRVFLAVPAAGGKALSIINDELHIRNASSAQVEGTGSESAVPDSQNVLTPQESRLAVTSPQQQEMLLRFSQQSTMNLEWSYKCLSENNWDYQKAALVFTSLKNNGSIPPEAFVQST